MVVWWKMEKPFVFVLENLWCIKITSQQDSLQGRRNFDERVLICI